MKIAYISFSKKLFVWLNLIIQTLFPLAAAFTPLDVGADNKTYVRKKTTETFPLTQTSQLQQIAELASKTGYVLSSNSKSDAMVDMTKGIVTSMAGSEIQQWFNQFGRARVQLDLDKKFTLQNSQVDLLVSLYEQKNMLVFSQGSLHRTDDRTQFNLGLGYRWFADAWMFGGNGFLDYDLSRHHTRIGVGIECWSDFLRVGINSYKHLTNWKKSPNVIDYEERPADGLDIRAQAWLPSFPQLGGMLAYEQYYGQEVALFDRYKRCDSPRAITIGVNYTPIPLLTFSMEQRQGKFSKHDSLFGIDLNFHLGVPWQQQISSDEVIAMRSLFGRRYDFVKRNNNIVLEYRKRKIVPQNLVSEKFSFITRDKNSYMAGDKMIITVTLKDEKGKPISGEKPALEDKRMMQANMLANSSIKVGVENAKPEAEGEWQDNKDGTYVRTYIAVKVGSNLKATLKLDNWNKTSKSELYEIIANVPSEDKSSITRDKANYVPGDLMTIIVTLKDNEGNPITGKKSELDDSVDVEQAEAKDDWVDNQDGTYTRIYTAEKMGKGLKATLRHDGWNKVSESKAYNITQGVPSEDKSSIERDKASYVAGDSIIITVTLKDKQGNPLTERASDLTENTVKVENAKGKTRNWKDNQDGTYSRTYTAIKAGSNLKATLKLDDWNKTSESKTYEIIADVPSEDKSSITRDKANYMSGESMTITVTLKDKEDNPVIGQGSELDNSVTVENAKAKDDWVDNQDGTYTRIYTADKVGTDLKATLRHDSWNKASESKTYTIESGAPMQENSSIARDKASYVDGDPIVITVTLMDAQDNPVIGRASDLTEDTVKVENAESEEGSNWKDNQDGTYTRVYTADKTGTDLKATLKLDNWQTASESEMYEIKIGAPTEDESSIARDKASYVADDSMVITVILKDVKGNPVIGNASALKDAVMVANAKEKDSEWKDNQDGSYTRTYTAVTADSNLKATLKLRKWTKTLESETYEIKAGAPSEKNSSIARDKSDYTAGDLITITVTLKDEEGNIVIGRASDLTDDTVKVANAEKKGSWTDNGDGTYTCTYTAVTADSNLKATLKLDNWDAASESETYTIKAGAPVQKNSSITRNKSSYLDGDPIMIIVTLRDAEGNAVTGLTSSLTDDTVKVENSVDDGDWKDNQDGTYSRIYAADKLGTDLKATLKLDNWQTASESDVYEIKEGAPSEDHSYIVRDKAEYTVGDTIVLTVTLKDIKDNPVIGDPEVLENKAVKITNVKDKDDRWRDNQDGTYTRAYTAVKVGTDLKALLKLRKWTKTLESDTYEIKAGASSEKNSSIVRDKGDYTAGDLITITVTLKDEEGNPAVGRASDLTDDTVKVANAEKKDDWTDNGDGTYTRTYTAMTTGSNLKATLKMDNWANTLESEEYKIIADIKTAHVSSVVLNDSVTSKDYAGTFLYTAQLSDNYGNDILVDDLDVKWSSNGGNAVKLSVNSSKTDSSGKATVKLTSNEKDISDVVVSAQYEDTEKVDATKKVEFVITQVSINNGNDISCSEVENYLKDNNFIAIRTWDGHWAKNICIPNASSWPGKTIYVESQAKYDSNISVDGRTDVIKQGQKKKYHSDGKKW